MEEKEFFRALWLSSPDLEKAEMMLDENPDLVTSNHPNGYSAMHAIAEAGSTTLMKKAINHGGDIHAKDDEGQTPIWWAVDASAFDVAEMLLELGATMDEPKDNGYYLIHEETLYGDHEEMEYVLDKGMSANQRTADGLTPLHFAAMVSPRTIELLLLRGADIDSRDSGRRTPLFYAIDANKPSISNKIACVRCLLDHGADIHAQSSDGETLWAIARRYVVDDFVVLLDSYADEHQANRTGT